MNFAILTTKLSSRARASTQFVKYFVAMTMYRHQCTQLTLRGSTKSNPHHSNSSCACEGLSGIKSLFNGFPALWQVLQPTTHSRALLYTVGHHSPASSVFHVIVSSPICPPAGPSCPSFNTFGISSSNRQSQNVIRPHFVQ